MKVTELVQHTNALTDEDFPVSQVIGFLNDGMARINVECNANFPYLKAAENDVEPVFPEKWQRLLLCIFAAGRIKESDSSQFEYNDFYAQFDASIVEFKNRYTIPDEYKDASTNSWYMNDLSNSPWGW